MKMLTQDEFVEEYLRADALKELETDGVSPDIIRTVIWDEYVGYAKAHIKSITSLPETK